MVAPHGNEDIEFSILKNGKYRFFVFKKNTKDYIEIEKEVSEIYLAEPELNLKHFDDNLKLVYST